MAGVSKGVIGGEVTGVLGIGQKSDHVGPLKKVLPVPTYIPSALPTDACRPSGILLPLQLSV